MHRHTTIALTVFAAAGLLVATAFTQPAEQTRTYTVKPCAFSVTHAVEGLDRMTNILNDAPGTALALEVRGGKATFVDFDEHASKLDTFTDSEKTNLLTEREYQQIGFGAFPTFSPDLHTVVVSIRGGGVPAADAKTIRARGTLVFHVAEEQAEATAKDVALKAGQTLQLGPVEWKINRTGKPEWGDAKFELEVSSSTSASRIIALNIQLPDGRTIPARFSSSSSWTINDKTEYTLTYDFEEALPDKVSFIAKYWRDIEVVKIPFEVEVGVGF